MAWDDPFTARDYDRYMGYDDERPGPDEDPNDPTNEAPTEPRQLTAAGQDDNELPPF